MKLKKFTDNPKLQAAKPGRLVRLRSVTPAAYASTHVAPTRTARGVLGFKTNMGFGLHIGWAIEGAIGSPCKVLSTN